MTDDKIDPTPEDSRTPGGPAMTTISSKLDPAACAEIERRFNDIRAEVLIRGRKQVDWWLSGVAVFLTVLAVAAAIAGWFGFQRFDEIAKEAGAHVEEAGQHAEEAGQLVERIKGHEQEAKARARGISAQAVRDDPGEVERFLRELSREGAPALAAAFFDGPVGEAVRLQQAGKTREAIEKWRAIANLAEGVDNEIAADAWFSVGYLLQENEKPSPRTAIDAYGKAIELMSAADPNPNLAKAYYNRGNAKSSFGDDKDAIADYDSAIALNPKFAAAYNNRGNAKSNLGWHEDAIADLDEAIRLDPKSAVTFSDRGVVKGHLDRHEDAIADYDTAIALNPKFAEAFYNRGTEKNDLDRHEDAIADFDEAIRLKPNLADAYNNRGIAKANLGRHADAIADLDEAIRLKPNLADAYNNRGIAKRRLGNPNDAIADFDEAIRLKPNFVEAYNGRGIAKRNLGYHEDAIADYNEAIRLKPEYPEAYNNRGVAKADRDDLGDREGAIADFDTAIQLEPNLADAYNNRGIANADLGRKDAARRDFQKALELYEAAGNEERANIARRELNELDGE